MTHEQIRAIVWKSAYEITNEVEEADNVIDEFDKRFPPPAQPAAEDKWNRLAKICDDPEKWIEMYKHYQDLCTDETTKEWYADQTNMALQQLKQDKWVRVEDVKEIKAGFYWGKTRLKKVHLVEYHNNPDYMGDAYWTHANIDSEIIVDEYYPLSSPPTKNK